MEVQQDAAPELLVSVVIVSRNCVAALRKCVAALEQSVNRESIEIIVADNASRDGCESIDREFPGISPLRMQHHIGLTKARNIALRTARGPYLLLLSPDVIVEPDTVQKLIARLEEDSAALAVCPVLVDEAGKAASKAYRLPDASQVAAAWRDPLSLPAVAPGDSVELHDGKALFIRKGSVQGMNYLDERYGEFWGDVELAFQIKRAGKKIAMANDIRARLNTADGLWTPADSNARSAYGADAANGAAEYIGKHFGFGPALGFRLSTALGALVKALTFQDAGYHFGLLAGVVGMAKIDGTDKSL